MPESAAASPDATPLKCRLLKRNVPARLFALARPSSSGKNSDAVALPPADGAVPSAQSDALDQLPDTAFAALAADCGAVPAVGGARRMSSTNVALSPSQPSPANRTACVPAGSQMGPVAKST